jgi:hypothetical protein
LYNHSLGASGQGEGGRDAQEERDSDDGASSTLTPSQEQQAGDNNDNENSSTTRDNIGGISQQPPQALQSRASFLNGRPSYLLYFWVTTASQQLRGSCGCIATFCFKQHNKKQ